MMTEGKLAFFTVNGKVSMERGKTMKTFKVLSIDAWSDGQNCPHCGNSKLSNQTKGMKCLSCKEFFDENEGINWTWNNWFSAGEYSENAYGPLDEKSAIKYFAENFIHENKIDEFEIEDDQYNLVLVRKSDRMPVLAIEYGSQL